MIGKRRQVVGEAISANSGHLRHAHSVARIAVRHGRGTANVIEVRILLGAARLPVLLQMLLRMLQVVGTSRVASPY